MPRRPRVLELRSGWRGFVHGLAPITPEVLMTARASGSSPENLEVQLAQQLRDVEDRLVTEFASRPDVGEHRVQHVLALVRERFADARIHAFFAHPDGTGGARTTQRQPSPARPTDSMAQVFRAARGRGVRFLTRLVSYLCQDQAWARTRESSRHTRLSRQGASASAPPRLVPITVQHGTLTRRGAHRKFCVGHKW